MVNEEGQVVVVGADMATIESGEPEKFNPDNIPPKILVTATNIGDTGQSVALCHPEATY